MPLPILWLGAGLAAIAAGNHISKEYDRKKGVVGHFPGENKRPVKPKDGTIVCCGIYQMFEHTGIWVDGNIIELHGSGLIRGISPDRFLDNRSGECIYVACDAHDQPLQDNSSVLRAASKLYQVDDYHVLDYNCHRFVAECLLGHDAKVTSFTDFNHLIHGHFGQSIHWLPARL